MSEIDAKSLTVEERAIVDGIYLILRSNCTNGTEAERYADAVRQSCEAILARRALFAVLEELIAHMRARYTSEANPTGSYCNEESLWIGDKIQKLRKEIEG